MKRRDQAQKLIRIALAYIRGEKSEYDTQTMLLLMGYTQDEIYDIVDGMDALKTEKEPTQ